MSLKELTNHKHREAEATAFMQELIAGRVYPEVWTDFVYQKWVFYKTIESLAATHCGANALPEFFRTIHLFDDYRELAGNQQYTIRTSTIDYHNYLLSLSHHKDKIMAHVYVWHMGDLFGGQMIRKLVPGTNRHLIFSDRDQIIHFIRQQTNDSMAQEAIVAFDFAIRIMKEIFDIPV